MPLAEWNAVVAVNLTGAFLCTREAFQVMRQRPRGGRIINNGSISAHAPRPRSVAYTATKHAITGLTKATTLDGRAHDIACGQIDIGNAATALTEAMAAGVPGTQRAPTRIDVADVARAVCYGQPALGRQRRHHDRHGDQDAVHRPRLGWPVTTSSDLLAEATARVPAVRVWCGREANRAQGQTGGAGRGGL